MYRSETAIPAKHGRIPASSMVSRLRVPSQNAEYSSVNAPCTYFFSPAPDRSVVSLNPATAAAVIRARISRTTSAARPRSLPPGRNG